MHKALWLGVDNFGYDLFHNAVELFYFQSLNDSEILQSGDLANSEAKMILALVQRHIREIHVDLLAGGESVATQRGVFGEIQCLDDVILERSLKSQQNRFQHCEAACTGGIQVSPENRLQEMQGNDILVPSSCHADRVAKLIDDCGGVPASPQPVQREDSGVVPPIYEVLEDQFVQFPLRKHRVAELNDLTLY